MGWGKGGGKGGGGGGKKQCPPHDWDQNQYYKTCRICGTREQTDYPT